MLFWTQITVFISYLPYCIANYLNNNVISHYLNRGGRFGTNIDTINSASASMSLISLVCPNPPYFSSKASSNVGMMKLLCLFFFSFTRFCYSCMYLRCVSIYHICIRNNCGVYVLLTAILLNQIKFSSLYVCCKSLE